MYWYWMLTRLMVNTSQYTHIQKHYIVYLKLIHNITIISQFKNDYLQNF